MYVFDSSGSPWGIYPDMLHILDHNFLWPLCKCLPRMDWRSKYFWCPEPRWTSAKNPWDLHGMVHVKQQLGIIRISYFFSGLGLVFCENILNARKKINWGIPNSSRARALLFLSKTLQPKQSAYPSIGQKKLNGASSRMMIYFAMELANRINRDHPSDVNGCWVPKFKVWNIFG